ncbi:MAG TPA: GIY-YIG nuclease family protein, partial [Phenylobacterium sp.]|nr:GIY-YIG nuclease family protein [Phenylobacterium sp.]
NGGRISDVGAWLYILRCADKSYYVGSTRTDLEMRVAQHQAGLFAGYTSTRRPVELIYSEYFDRIVDAIAAERKVKGWSRAKKEALIRSDWAAISALSKRRGGLARPSNPPSVPRPIHPPSSS